MRKVKIVATLGPSTDGPERMAELIRAGLDVARLNFSHGSHEEHRRRYEEVRAVSREVGQPVAVLADLSGPKIRVGRMAGGAIELQPGAEVVLIADDGLEGTAGRIGHSYPTLAEDMQPGQHVLLDDGKLELAAVVIEGGEVRCRVVTGGWLSDHKGMNLPGTTLSTPALTDKDRDDLVYARELGVDYFALSFVRTPDDVAQAKALAGDVPVIAKIEKPEAVARLDQILEVADGAMVARGDLGVEAGHEKVPLIQKRIITETNLRGKPVITATQMLESMIGNPAPTRAEVSDVANAILDGTDAVMLSGETAVGRYPVAAVELMRSIAEEIESSEYYSAHFARPEIREQSFSNAIADGAAEVAKVMGLAAIAVYTESGRSAKLVSAHRPRSAVAAFSRHDRIARRLALYWGVRPVHAEWVRGIEAVIEQTERVLKEQGLAQAGDDIAITFGNADLDVPFQTTMLKLWKVR